MTNETLPTHVRKNNTATIIYKMMPTEREGLEQKLGVHRNTIATAIKLLSDNNLIYISQYKSGRNCLNSCYEKGDKPNAIRPTSKQLSNARNATYRRNNPECLQKFYKSYREKNRELLLQKSNVRYISKKAEISAKAIAKRKEKRLSLIEPIPATKWAGANPFQAML